MLKSPIITTGLKVPSENEPSPWTPLDNDNVYNICDGDALIDTREGIRRLGETCHAVQMSFIAVIKSVEDLTLLNALKRIQLRAVIRQLPVLRALYEDFKQIVILSQKEASSACGVLVSYQTTILDASFTSITAVDMKDEIDNIAKFVGKHKDEAEKLQVEFTQLSYKIDRVSAAINLAIAKERENADKRIIAVSQQTAKLGGDVEEYAKSRMAFLGGLHGVGEQCAGIAIASFGSEGDFPDDITLVEEPISKAAKHPGRRYMRLHRRRVRTLQALNVIWVAGGAQDLQEKAKLVAAIGNIWHNLHMDLHRISEWLSRRFERGEWQGAKSPEVYGLAVSTIRDLNREVVHQLDRYAKSQLLQGAHK